MKIDFKNEGKGVLHHIGFFSFETNRRMPYDKVEFIRESNKYCKVFDMLYTPRRFNTVGVNETYYINALWKIKIDVYERYIYVIDFYKDQDGNLYSTLYSLYIKYKNIFSDYVEFFQNGDYKLHNIPKDQATSIASQLFYSYSIKEHNDLYNYIRNVEDKINRTHSLSDAIGIK